MGFSFFIFSQGFRAFQSVKLELEAPNNALTGRWAPFMESICDDVNAAVFTDCSSIAFTLHTLYSKTEEPTKLLGR